MPTGIHTAKKISDNKRQAIVLALASGEGKSLIAKRLHTSDHIVNIVLQEQWQQVANHKSILLAQAERNALEAGHQVAQALAERKFPVQSLPVVYGISVDKVTSLSPPPAPDSISQHLHLHLEPVDIAGTFNSFLHSLQAKAREINAATPPPTHPDCHDVILEPPDRCALPATTNSVKESAVLLPTDRQPPTNSL